MRRYLLLLAVVVMVSALELSAGTFTVTTPGPLDSPSINTSILNNDGFDLLRVTFDLSGTHSFAGEQLVIDNFGYFNLTPPAGGTATYFQADPLGGGFSTFGFDFTSFNNSDSFSFSWDPDIPSNSSYTAVVAETAGINVTLLTTGGTVSGVMYIVGNDVTATIQSPIPEPASLLLFGSGIVGLAGVLRRKLNF